jgi:hypothetical protein
VDRDALPVLLDVGDDRVEVHPLHQRELVRQRVEREELDLALADGARSPSVTRRLATFRRPFRLCRCSSGMIGSLSPLRAVASNFLTEASVILVALAILMAAMSPRVIIS